MAYSSGASFHGNANFLPSINHNLNVANTGIQQSGQATSPGGPLSQSFSVDNVLAAGKSSLKIATKNKNGGGSLRSRLLQVSNNHNTISPQSMRHHQQYGGVPVNEAIYKSQTDNQSQISERRLSPSMGIHSQQSGRGGNRSVQRQKKNNSQSVASLDRAQANDKNFNNQSNQVMNQMMRPTDNNTSGHRKLFKSPKVQYFIDQFTYDRNKSTIEHDRAKAMYDRRFDYYNEIKNRSLKRKQSQINSQRNSHESSVTLANSRKTPRGAPAGQGENSNKPINYLHQMMATREASEARKQQSHYADSHVPRDRLSILNTQNLSKKFKSSQKVLAGNPSIGGNRDSIGEQEQLSRSSNLSRVSAESSYDDYDQSIEVIEIEDMKVNNHQDQTSKSDMKTHHLNYPKKHHKSNSHLQASSEHVSLHHDSSMHRHENSYHRLPQSIHYMREDHLPTPIIEEPTETDQQFYAISPLEQLQKNYSRLTKLHNNLQGKKKAPKFQTQDRLSQTRNLGYSASTDHQQFNDRASASNSSEESALVELQATSYNVPQNNHLQSHQQLYIKDQKRLNLSTLNSVPALSLVASPRKIGRLRKNKGDKITQSHALLGGPMTTLSNSQLPMIQAHSPNNHHQQIFQMPSHPLLQSMPTFILDQKGNLIQQQPSTGHPAMQPQYQIIRVKKKKVKTASYKNKNSHVRSHQALVVQKRSENENSHRDLKTQEDCDESEDVLCDGPVEQIKVPTPPKVEEVVVPPPDLPDNYSPEPLIKPRMPRTDILMFDEEPQEIRDAYFKMPKQWRKLFQKEKPRIYSPPRLPDDEEMPLKKAAHEYLPESPERVPPALDQILQVPQVKLKPKKTSDIEPPSISFGQFEDQDMVYMSPGEIEGVIKPRLEEPLPQPVLLPLPVSEEEKVPEPEPKQVKPKKAKKKKEPKSKKSSRMVKVVTERIEAPEESEDLSEEESKPTKARANHLPPVEILFAHLDRVDTMKSKVEPVMKEISTKSKPTKKQASFSQASNTSKSDKGGSFVGSFSGQAQAATQESSLKRSKSRRKKKKDLPEELNSSGSQSPGPRIGSDQENDIDNRISEEDDEESIESNSGRNTDQAHGSLARQSLKQLTKETFTTSQDSDEYSNAHDSKRRLSIKPKPKSSLQTSKTKQAAESKIGRGISGKTMIPNITSKSRGQSSGRTTSIVDEVGSVYNSTQQPNENSQTFTQYRKENYSAMQSSIEEDLSREQWMRRAQGVKGIESDADRERQLSQLKREQKEPTSSTSNQHQIKYQPNIQQITTSGLSNSDSSSADEYGIKNNFQSEVKQTRLAKMHKDNSLRDINHTQNRERRQTIKSKHEHLLRTRDDQSADQKTQDKSDDVNRNTFQMSSNFAGTSKWDSGQLQLQAKSTQQKQIEQSQSEETSSLGDYEEEVTQEIIQLQPVTDISTDQKQSEAQVANEEDKEQKDEKQTLRESILKRSKSQVPEEYHHLFDTLDGYSKQDETDSNQTPQKPFQAKKKSPVHQIKRTTTRLVKKKNLENKLANKSDSFKELKNDHQGNLQQRSKSTERMQINDFSVHKHTEPRNQNQKIKDVSQKRKDFDRHYTFGLDQEANEDSIIDSHMDVPTLNHNQSNTVTTTMIFKPLSVGETEHESQSRGETSAMNKSKSRIDSPIEEDPMEDQSSQWREENDAPSPTNRDSYYAQYNQLRQSLTDEKLKSPRIPAKRDSSRQGSTTLDKQSSNNFTFRATTRNIDLSVQPFGSIPTNAISVSSRGQSSKDSETFKMVSQVADKILKSPNQSSCMIIENQQENSQVETSMRDIKQNDDSWFYQNPKPGFDHHQQHTQEQVIRVASRQETRSPKKSFLKKKPQPYYMKDIPKTSKLVVQSKIPSALVHRKTSVQPFQNESLDQGPFLAQSQALGGGAPQINLAMRHSIMHKRTRQSLNKNHANNNCSQNISPSSSTLNDKTFQAKNTKKGLRNSMDQGVMPSAQNSSMLGSRVPQEKNEPNFDKKKNVHRRNNFLKFPVVSQQQDPVQNNAFKQSPSQMQIRNSSGKQPSPSFNDYYGEKITPVAHYNEKHHHTANNSIERHMPVFGKHNPLAMQQQTNSDHPDDHSDLLGIIKDSLQSLDQFQKSFQKKLSLMEEQQEQASSHKQPHVEQQSFYRNKVVEHDN